MCVACGLNTFDKTLEYSPNREQFGQHIVDFQGIEWKLADMATELEAAWMLIYRAAASARGSDRSRIETSMPKANEAAQEIIDDALQIHGAIGYMM